MTVPWLWQWIQEALEMMHITSQNRDLACVAAVKAAAEELKISRGLGSVVVTTTSLTCYRPYKDSLNILDGLTVLP